jgi:hypothetical protein
MIDLKNQTTEYTHAIIPPTVCIREYVRCLGRREVLIAVGADLLAPGAPYCV